jgi:hypothetical protein
MAVAMCAPRSYKGRTDDLPEELKIMFRLMSGDTAQDIEGVD